MIFFPHGFEGALAREGRRRKWKEGGACAYEQAQVRLRIQPRCSKQVIKITPLVTKT